MRSFIASGRHRDRLLASILLWNVIAGALVTLGAPWLAEFSGATGLRQPSELPAGSGWLAIGVPTHFAGIWLSAIGGYALHRMRRHLPWHAIAVAFYAPQTFAIASPAHVDVWAGLFVATSFQPRIGAAFAVNWFAIALLLAHAWAGVSGSRFRTHFERVPAATFKYALDFWGSRPLSRAALSRRYASIAAMTAIVFLPLVPADAFYPNRQALEFIDSRDFSGWFEKQGTVHWRLLLLLPMTFGVAYVMAFVWSGDRREPRFSARRGVVSALLAYVYLAMAADLSSRGLSDGQSQLFRLFMVAWVYMLPMMLLLPAIGGLAGRWLGRSVAADEGDRHRPLRLTLGMWLTLVAPLLALLLSYALDAPERNRIDAAREVARTALAYFDRNEPDRLYAMLTTESQAMIGGDAFIATLRERRASLGELQGSDARKELRHRWYPRAGIVQFDYSRAGVRDRSSESIVIDVRGSRPSVAAVFMSFEGQPPAHNVFAPRRDCGNGIELLHCGRIDDVPQRSLF